MADSQRKTANLFDKFDIVGQVPSVSNGNLVNYNNGACTDLIEISSGLLALSIYESMVVYVFLYDANKSFLGWANITSAGTSTTRTITNYENAKYARVRTDNYSTYLNEKKIMLNTGSTALPYEPYWQHSLRKLGTATDTITTLPADIYADGNNATVGLVGNMSQTGTPSPTTPIQPSECGERTANLFSSNWEQGSINGNTGNNQNSDIIVRTAGYIPITYNVLYSMKRDKASGYMNLRLYNANKNYIGVGANEYISVIVGTSATNPMGTGYTFCVFKSISEDVAYIRINDSTNDLSTQYMMVEGEYTEQTMPSYQPYGYKIPISSGGVTTNVYLGEVQSTRKIKKVVFDGTEDWGMTSGNKMNLTLTDIPTTGISPICTHYQGISATSYSSVNNNEITVSIVQSGNSKLALYDDRYTAKADFLAYLAAQYSAGTPVCVWYVLATPETGIVNEPIRKIGDYADTVSGITIPTTAGADSFDVLTTLKPSEVELTYTGWHDASVKEWDGSEWQDEQPVSLLSASSRPTLTESTPDIMDITEEPEEKE